jgi:hypothetical protein
MPPNTWITRLSAWLYPDSPALDVVALNIDMSQVANPASTHVLKITSPSLPTAAHTFVFPPSDGARWLYFFVLPSGAITAHSEAP